MSAATVSSLGLAVHADHDICLHGSKDFQVSVRQSPWARCWLRPVVMQMVQKISPSQKKLGCETKNKSGGQGLIWP